MSKLDRASEGHKDRNEMDLFAQGLLQLWIDEAITEAWSDDDMPDQKVKVCGRPFQIHAAPAI